MITQFIIPNSAASPMSMSAIKWTNSWVPICVAAEGREGGREEGRLTTHPTTVLHKRLQQILLVFTTWPESNRLLDGIRVTCNSADVGDGIAGCQPLRWPARRSSLRACTSSWSSKQPKLRRKSLADIPLPDWVKSHKATTCGVPPL